MRKREYVMLAHKATEKLIKNLGSVFYTQPKLNGVRCLAVNNPGNVKLFSSTHLEKPFLDHIKNELKKLPTEVIYDGELYTHGQSWNWINSRASCTVNRHPEEELLNFTIFDIKDYYASQKLRFNQLLAYKEITHTLKHINILRTDYATIETWEENLDRYVAEGYEGIIFRHQTGDYEDKRTNALLKLKLTTQTDFLITDIIQGKGWCYNRCGAIEVTSPAGKFNVGTGPLFTAENRLEIWNNRKQYIGKLLTVRHEYLKTKNQFPVSTSAIGIK